MWKVAMAKDRKTLTDADIVSQRTPGRRTGHAADTDGAHAHTDRDAGKPAPTDTAKAAKDPDKAKDSDAKTDHDKR
jgi:hypothetical protein